MNAIKVVVLAVSLFTGFAAAPSRSAGGEVEFSYSNPLDFKYDQGQTVERREVRDPCIIREGDSYYLVFTMWPFSNREERRLSEPNQGGSPGIAIYSSKDLKRWNFESWLVKSSGLQGDCPYKNRFWAPEIHKIGGKFYLIFTADNWIDGRFNRPGKWGSAGYSFIGVADTITGPYRHITYVEGGTCDMTLFADGDGRTYAVKPKGDVFLQQIDLTHLDKDEVHFVGREQRVVSANNDDIALKASPAYLEGPWLEKIGQQYCLFYAALYKDKAFPDQLGYRTGVAYADSMAGLWRKDPRGAVFFGGHLAVFDGPDGRKWFSYRNEQDAKNRGMLCIDPIDLDAQGRVQAHETLGGTGASPTAWRPANGPLMTRWAADVSPANVLPEYPRPQMVRKEWQNLNGLWDYTITPKSEDRPPAAYEGKILVPYPIESALSGVMKTLQPEQTLWYRRTFDVPQAWLDGRIKLHFGAVDWACEVWIDGKSIGRHLGGYDGFTFDLNLRDIIAKAGSHEIVVGVNNPVDKGWQPRGKQVLHPGGAAYTASSGIWETVWLEPVPKSAIDQLTLVPDLKGGALRITLDGRLVPSAPLKIVATAFDGANPVASVEGVFGSEFALPYVTDNLVKFYKATLAWTSTDLTLAIPHAKAWSPESPFLYDLKIELEDPTGKVVDTVTSYFGLRDVALAKDEKGRQRIFLNGQPILLLGALDQGFWPDGIYTAPTDAALRFDLEAVKRLSLNCVRKHVKVEPDRWYFWADKLGVLVLQDMPSSQCGDPYTDLPTSPEASEQYQVEFQRVVADRINHPSIIGWVPFNEGWGQHDTRRIARLARALDPSRMVDEASGFPWHGSGDIADQHGGWAGTHPLQAGLNTETCGFGLTVPGHDWPGKHWATGTYDPATGKQTTGKYDHLYPLDSASLKWNTDEMLHLYVDNVAAGPRIGTSGNFKCQLTDVETESNGLLSYDRAIWKVEPDAIAAALRAARDALPK